MSEVQCVGCMLGTTPRRAKRGMSAGARIWACSTRSRGRRPPVASTFSKTSSASVLARSPIACTQTWKPRPTASRVMRSTSSGGTSTSPVFAASSQYGAWSAAPGQGWLSARTLAGLAAGLAILTGFVLFERRRRAPLIDPRVFARRGLSAGSLSIFVQFFGFFGFIFIVLQYLQLIRGDSGLMSAVSMLPMAAAMMPTARLAPALVARLGARATCTGGLVLIAAALAGLAQLTGTSSYWLVAAGLVPLGIGMGLAMTPATSGITAALPASQQGVGSAINDLSREVGGAVGIAVLASILTSAYQSHLHLGHLPAAVAVKARASVAIATHLGGPVAAQAHTAFADGLHLALVIAAGIVAAAAVAVFALLRGQDRPTGGTPA